MLIVNWTSCVKPESNPAVLLAELVRYVQGFSNDDCVTECAIPELGNQNVTRVPTAAVMFAGLKTKLPLAATSTFMLLDVLGGADGAAGSADVVVPAGAAGPPPYPGYCAEAKAGSRKARNGVANILTWA
jgi:hypothetical protein